MRTDAVILRTQAWREHDLFTHCYTEHSGVVSAVAKGALRDGSVQGMYLNQGNVVRFELVSGRGAPIITGTSAVRMHAAVRNSWPRQAATWAFLESVHTLVTAPERDERLWQVLTDALLALDTCALSDVLPRLRNAQRDLLGVLGYMPQVETCGVCGALPAGARTSFSVELGSIVCSRCTNAGWYGVALDEEDRFWLASRQPTAPCASRAVRAPTERLIEYVSGRPLASLNLLFGAAHT